MEESTSGQLIQYAPVLVVLVLSAAIIAGMMAASALLGKRGARTPAKDSPYECGMPSSGPLKGRMSIQFYLVAMLFILFDIELVFLYPWAVIFKESLGEGLGGVLFFSMLTFVGFLGVGYVYALRRGAFDWTR